MAYPDIKIGCVSNLFSRQMNFKNAGDVEIGHKHEFDHLSLLANGSVKIVIDGIESIFKSPHMIYIQKNKIHEITALENNTIIYCIHALRDINKTEDILDPDMIPKGINPLRISKPLIKID